ncbi:hypothetical protein M7I_0093 [Glarea lozoyensis 74030]|uniref:Uncharacterized protein n=1 Tax=Glarea lozoyensis (strain ATCC 74030 / MF5533) TaxID=1104152 RepID=H0ECF6_GLAL7|nr:hypothetical protein M7I_0093 [Glarea lozoyensis 74030]
MVVLHTSDGDIEVRLVKLDSDTESFEEYGYVDELDFDIDSDEAINTEDNISDDLNDAQLGSLKVTIVRLGKLRETGAILSSHVSVPDMTKRRDDTGQVNYNKRGVTHDIRLTVAHKISLAGEEANTEEIRRQILHEGVRPNKWRKWSQLMARERPILYKELQVKIALNLDINEKLNSTTAQKMDRQTGSDLITFRFRTRATNLKV